MAAPVILAVDDDHMVLGALKRDLQRQYGDRFRVIGADAGQAALDALGQLRLRGEPVALVIADQRMPHMTGVEFLEKAAELYPNTRRILLTAYADTEAAIRAINKAKIDYYMTKPWDPPEENLYPVTQDLLQDWSTSFRPAFDGIRVVGLRWSSRSHDIKEFLVRNQIPYQWLDVESDAEARRLAELAGAQARLPLVLFPDGTRLELPTQAELAQKVGLKMRAEMPFYDLIIVGGGPAGLAAAVYGASEGLQTIIVEREAPGGQAGMSARIENYLGFPVGLSGADLARRAVAQATRFGVEILTPQEATGLRTRDRYRFIRLADGSELSCHALIVATGVSYRKLDVPGADRLTGSGIYYGAAMTEALSCHNGDVFVVGGGNSAGQAAMYLSGYARHVTMLVRGDSLAQTMSQYLVDQIRAASNIAVRTHSVVAAVEGETSLESVTVAGAASGAQEKLAAVALFIFIGAMPRTEWMGDIVECDGQGYIVSGQRRPRGWPLDRDPYLLETNVPGIFAAGDVRSQSMKRIASAVGEGAMAVSFVHQYLASL